MQLILPDKSRKQLLQQWWMRPRGPQHRPSQRAMNGIPITTDRYWSRYYISIFHIRVFFVWGMMRTETVAVGTAS